MKYIMDVLYPYRLFSQKDCLGHWYGMELQVSNP